MYFRKRFLIANTKVEMFLKMLFVKFSNADILFENKTFT